MRKESDQAESNEEQEEGKDDMCDFTRIVSPSVSEAFLDYEAACG